MTERHDSVSFEQFREAAGDDLGFARRALSRYLFPKNIEASIKRHERLGTPVLRNVVMGTIGRAFKHLPNHRDIFNYFLPEPTLEGALSFSAVGTVINEGIHLGVAGQMALTNLNTSTYTQPFVEAFKNPTWYHSGDLLLSTPSTIALNLGLVAVQRYNRARVMHVANRALEYGHYPDSSRRNWLHLDGRTSQHLIEEHSQQGMISQPELFDWAVEYPELTDSLPPNLRLLDGGSETA